MTYHLAFGIAVTTVLACCLAQFLGRYVINYRMTDDSLQIMLLGVIPILKVLYRDIASAEILPFKKSLRPSLAWRFGNRIVVKEGVLIRKRRYGIFHKFVITPDNAVLFVSEMNRRLAAALHV